MQTFPNIGVDIAKDAVVVTCDVQSFSTHSVINQRAFLMTWLKSLPTGSRVGLKFTGGYHELLADQTHVQGHVVYLLNLLLDTEHYACAMGNRVKMDRMDVKLTTRLIVQEHTRPRSSHPLQSTSASEIALDPTARQYRSHQKLAYAADDESNLGRVTAEFQAAASNKLDALVAKIDSTMIAIAVH